MVKESPPYDFLIILHALLCKRTSRIPFSNKFTPPGKIDRPIAVFELKKKKKKVDIIEKYNTEAW